MLDQKLAEKALLAISKNPLLHPLGNVALPLPPKVALKAVIPRYYKGIFWETICSVDQYKLEKNKITQHYRLLDNKSIMIFWGTEKDMEKYFGTIIKNNKY
ncbi:hypothetical protein [Ruminococcus albus]|uniref:hypothetical protein n=1 Tax=Ruminococcus albus TaxID=1264 RepID=UPI000463E19D|nr:hypothetical protein [Ruminococcus albus]